MASNILETLRQNFELIERGQIEFGEELNRSVSGQMNKVLQQHKLKQMTEEMHKLNNSIHDTYFDDSDNLLERQLKKMREGGINSFYSSLDSLQQSFISSSAAATTSTVPTLTTVELFNNEKYKNDILSFSGEEIFGKYLDLNEFYKIFINIYIKDQEKLNKNNDKTKNIYNNIQDYLEYLERFSSFFYLSNSLRSSREFINNYLTNLWKYLTNFYKKTNPMIDLDSAIKQWESEFKEKCQKGEIKNYLNNSPFVTPSSANTSASSIATSFQIINSSTSISELESLGLDKLKEILVSLSLKAGGSLKERAERLWSVRGKSLEEIPNNLKAKGANNKGSENNSNHSENESLIEKGLKLEFLISSLCAVMSDTISNTRRHIEKQQTRNIEEKLHEFYEEIYDNSNKQSSKKKVEEEEEEEFIYNPLNIPLTWDGKPIPYWLYKLHGLGVEYKCQICGDQSYWGRKNYEKHFSEAKHTYGMKCLGIPNTVHFFDINKIEDAVNLYNKIKKDLRHKEFDINNDEEYEDSDGNVMDRRTYEDLARQGLL